MGGEGGDMGEVRGNAGLAAGAAADASALPACDGHLDGVFDPVPGMEAAGDVVGEVAAVAAVEEVAHPFGADGGLGGDPDAGGVPGQIGRASRRERGCPNL